MQRFKLDVSLAQFLAVARGEVIDLNGIKFEMYEDNENEQTIVKAMFKAKPKTATAKPPVKTRARRRTKAEMEAAKAQREKDVDTHIENIEASQRAFPWQDKTMNTDPEAA